MKLAGADCANKNGEATGKNLNARDSSVQAMPAPLEAMGSLRNGLTTGGDSDDDS